MASVVNVSILLPSASGENEGMIPAPCNVHLLVSLKVTSGPTGKTTSVAGPLVAGPAAFRATTKRVLLPGGSGCGFKQAGQMRKLALVAPLTAAPFKYHW